MQYTSYIIIAIIVPLVLKFLRQSRPALRNNQGFNVMKYPKAYINLGKYSFVFILVMAIIFLLDIVLDFSWTENPQTLVDFVVPIGVMIVMMVISISLILQNRHFLMYDDEKIIFRGIFGKVVEMSWKDINRVTFSKQMLEFFIHDKNNKIYVHKHLSGFNMFVEKLKSKVDLLIINKALANLDETRGR